MPLPSSGPLSLSQVNTELGRTTASTVSLGEAAVRALAGALSGPVSMAGLRGKSAVSVTITPSGRAESGSTAARTFGSFTVSAVGGTPSAYSWTISGAANGAFNPGAGSTTTTTSPTVSGVLSGDTATATLTCTVTVGGVNYSSSVPLSYTRTGAG